jgi:hypothetical protein
MQSEMVVVPWNKFWKHYSPWIPSENDVQQGVSMLETAELWKNEWAKNIDPAAGPDENTGFKSLEEIASKLEHVGIRGRQASYRLVHRPTRVALSTISAGNHMVDGCFYPIEEISSDPTAIVALEMRRTTSIHEYKRRDRPKDVHDVSLPYLSHHYWLI